VASEIAVFVSKIAVFAICCTPLRWELAAKSVHKPQEPI
jgi:hypothetical protein